jgi:asparagine synthase (glutamine-hydrolysing)
MCGIAGIATTDGLRESDLSLVDRMLAVLSHRGPDQQRFVSDRNAAIGARRLAIIDLETGGQPIGNEDGSIQVTQNGEIYNYVELRELLARLGHQFRTQGDTETIVHLYEEYGEHFVDHLRGMFAIALWDAPRRRLILVRDRLGKKPLYWRLHEGRLSYGSELKALLCDPTVPRVVDRVSLARYLQYQYIPAPGTILAGVQKLEPASMLVWEAAGETRVQRYWHLRYVPKVERRPEEEREECLALLREAVRLRLRSDVPLGLFLSGGMDSSTVLALMAERTARPVMTFTIGFEDAGYDERAHARSIARHFATEHHEEVVRLDAISLLPDLATHYDEPFGDSSAIPTYRVAQLAARHVRVVLTGDGGDETFGGYGTYRSQLALNRLQVLPVAVRRSVVCGRNLVRGLAGRRLARSDSITSLEELVSLPADMRYVRTMSMSDLRLRARLLRDDAVADQDEYLLSVMRSGPRGPLDRMLAADTVSYLPDDLLTKMDRATMAHSLEARAPLLDHRLTEFAATLPPERKLRGKDSKVLLREVSRKLLPPGFINRPKHGFAVPLGGWFRGPLGDVYRDTVLSPEAILRDHLDQEAAASLLDEHLGGAVDHGRRLWLLLSFELWARRWLRDQTEVQV